ncbi:MAG: efflux RND transporter permease subunit, partial [Lachnospiraceae bacterium]|nr:efflux RND transporter permease subunit [Lachnospiraceae bacterium]
MHHLTKGILKRPITVLVTLMALVVFAFVSIKSITMKLTPDMSIPMLAAYTIYPGAAPEEVDELVSKKIESNCDKVSGVKSSQSRSSENVSIVILQFDYGTDLDDAYNDVKKQLDALANELPEDCQTPLLIEADFEAMDDLTISVTPTAEGVDVLKTVNDNVEPMLSTMSALAQTTITGGDERYISVELIPEYAQQYGFSIDSICSAITAVNFSMPAGSADYGSQNLSLAAEAKYETIEELEQVPITTSTGKTIHLGDVARIKYAVSEKSEYSRYNGVSNVSIGLKRKNGSTAVDLSNQYKKLLPKLQAENPDLNFDVVYDTADEIISSLKSVAVTLIEAIILSMLVLFIFFGDFKASLIVGSSMPISLLFTFILMGFMNFSLNIVTMNALVIGIGMMVDNAIVVIEMCFRKRDDGLTFMDAAYEGTKLVINSITGSTITTIVVYLPLALMKGLSGQMFKEMGFTIIFAIGSSLISAMTIIPFFFSRFKPVEKKENITNRGLRRFAEVYGKILARIL